MMDKLLRKNWLVKIISFLIALMLYAIVSTGESPSSDPSSVVSSMEESTMTQKLNVIYDSNKYVVSGAPKNVTVHIEGTGNLVFKARLVTKSAYINLENMNPGTYNVRVQTKGFPSGLKVRSVPKTVRVRIQKKTSKEFPVAIDEVNKEKVGKEYNIGDPEINPKVVMVTGGEETLQSIAFVKGVVDLRGATGTLSRTATLHAYNNSGDQLNVTIRPSAVRVQIPLISLTRKLDLHAQTTGVPASGYTVRLVELSPNQVTVSAADAVTLKSMASVVPLSVPVNGLKGDKTFSIGVPLPAGATEVVPSKAKVTVRIDKSSSETATSASSSSSSSSSVAENSGTQTKEFSNIPVKIIGTKNGQTAELSDRDTVNVSVKGDSDALNKLSNDDIKAQIDAGDLDMGENKATVLVSVPEGFTATCQPEKLSVTIS